MGWAFEGKPLDYPHRPVLVQKVLEDLITDPEGIYIDGTVGSGGHSEAIGKRIGKRGQLLCLDRDSEAIRISTQRLGFLGERVRIIRASYGSADQVLRDLGWGRAHGILLDLGMSGFQLDESGRGFSFNRDEPLDMRMDPDAGVTAEHLVHHLSEKELEEILRQYGEEKRARAIARRIGQERKTKPIRSSLHLAHVIESVVPRPRRAGAKHPATRTFQALRIAVNKELEHLASILDKSPALLAAGGRLVILSYHSLEDRMVKHAMVRWEKGCECPPTLPQCGCGKEPLFRRLHKKGVRPEPEEIEDNPRARSAVLRAAERIPTHDTSDQGLRN
jgi:16S rRNA (cytosine1402-N4)-methyltransferase